MFAPTSRITQEPVSVGQTTLMAARLIPLIRLVTRVATVSRAPVLPADTKASPPALRSFAPTTMEESL